MAKNEEQAAGERPLTEFERVQMEYQKELILEMRSKRAQAEELRETLKQQRIKAVADMERDRQARARRQAICQHKKGGRNNNFAKGNSADHSINLNTYPDGTKVLFCTRCFAERVMPSKRLRKENRRQYNEMLERWNEWAKLSTDNSPSGGQIFMLEVDAA